MLHKSNSLFPWPVIKGSNQNTFVHSWPTQGKLGNWMSPAELEENVSKLFPGCMQGRTMYMIPFR